MNRRVEKVAIALLVMMLATLLFSACGSSPLTPTSPATYSNGPGIIATGPSTGLTNAPIDTPTASASSTPITVTPTPPVNPTPTPGPTTNQQILELFRPWTGDLDELALNPAITRSVTDWFQNSPDLMVKAYVTDKNVSFYSIFDTMTEEGFYGLLPPAKHGDLFGTIFIRQNKETDQQVAFKFVALKPDNPLINLGILTREFKPLGCDQQSIAKLQEQLQGKLYLFLLVVGKEVLETYSAQVEKNIVPVTPFTLTEIDRPRLITEGDPFEGDLRLFPTTREASSTWKSLYLVAKGMAIFPDQLARKFKSNRYAQFSINLSVAKPWRLDTENIVFSADIRIGEMAGLRVAWKYDTLYINEDNSGWGVLDVDSELGYELYAMLMSLIYPLMDNKTSTGWTFTSLQAAVLDRQLTGGYSLEKSTADGRYSHIEVRYNPENYRLTQYSEKNSNLANLVFSYEYDTSNLEIAYPDRLEQTRLQQK